MRGNPHVEPHPDGYKVTWPGFKKAFALFDITRDGVVVTDIFRDPAQPKGCAGAMLADALLIAGARKPKTIRVANILSDQPTLGQLALGIPPGQTVLGKTVTNTVAALGGTATEWRHGIYRDKHWIEVSISY